jgi:hypothetical protein
MSHGSVTRTAKFYGDQGCIIHQPDHDGIFFTPVQVKTRLPDAASQPWPMGDVPSVEPAPAGIDAARIAKAVDLAFSDPEGLTAAFVVGKKPVYGGLFWVNGDGGWNIPKSAHMANGAGGQRTFIIPTHDLVVVRRGHYRGDRPGMKALNLALAELIGAVPPRE